MTGVTDPASSQWAKADELLGHFPGRERLLAEARKDLLDDGLTWERDVKPALGAELDLALLDFNDADHNYVFFTKPKDQAKFDHLLETGDDPTGAPRDRRLDGLRRQPAGRSTTSSRRARPATRSPTSRRSRTR